MTLNNTVEGMRQKRRAEQKSIFTTTIQTSPYGHFGFPGVLNMMVIVWKPLMQITRNPFMCRFGLSFLPVRIVPVLPQSPTGLLKRGLHLFQKSLP